MNEIVSMISNVGFPIACVIMLWWQQSKQMKELTDAVNNYTLAITSLVERLKDNES